MMLAAFLDVNDFKDYNLTTNEVTTAFVLFGIILCFIGIFAKIIFKDDIKKMSWIISLFNSFILTIIGFIYLFVKTPMYKNFFFFGDNGRNLFHSSDNVAVLTCIWFGLANFFDLVFGLLFYAKYLDPLTAYVHHIVYIWLMITSTTGNGFFIHCEVFCVGFVYVAIEELPTFLLALGSVFPALRTDIGFGITFFFLRLVYHSYMLSYSILSKSDYIVTILYILTLTLHVFWFTTWMSKYGSKLLGFKEGSKKAKVIIKTPATSSTKKVKTK